MKNKKILVPLSGSWQRIDNPHLPESQMVQEAAAAYATRYQAVLEPNIRLSTKHTLEILHHLISKGFTPEAAYLNIDAFDCFNVLIKVTEADILHEAFLEVYPFVSESERSYNQEQYHISFGFCGGTGGIDEFALQADGYLYKMLFHLKQVPHEKAACYTQ